MTSYALYQPINTLKPIAENIWIVDGPEIRMTYPWLKFLWMPFPTRMTVVRLSDGALWLHSPTPVCDELAGAIELLGTIRFLIAPNRLHYWWIGDWRARYPQAIAYAAPGVRESAAGRFDHFDEELADTPPAEWRGEIEHILVRGDFMTEAEFLHIASRTLILTDLVENFEPRRFASRFLRWLVRMAGCADPDGTMPVDLRATFHRHRAAMRQAVERMLAWAPDRVVLAHGRWYPDNAVLELKRAFRWVL